MSNAKRIFAWYAKLSANDLDMEVGETLVLVKCFEFAVEDCGVPVQLFELYSYYFDDVVWMR